MSFDSDQFDIVFESTMFVQLTDEHLARGTAHEMVRVTKPDGYIVLADWRYSKPGNSNYSGVSKARIAKLFDVGRATEIVRRVNGALVPPLGRFLSHYMPSLYFAVRALVPFAVGQTTTVLQKRGQLGISVIDTR
jgi:ubiquinone/menaquinone biosynthesis C-methylase UbiE